MKWYRQKYLKNAQWLRNIAHFLGTKKNQKVDLQDLLESISNPSDMKRYKVKKIVKIKLASLILPQTC